TVMQLVTDVGFDAVDAGDLTQARLLEPLAMLWICQRARRRLRLCARATQWSQAEILVWAVVRCPRRLAFGGPFSCQSPKWRLVILVLSAECYMAILGNVRQELFARNIANGLAKSKAYESAGYKPSKSNVPTLFRTGRRAEGRGSGIYPVPCRLTTQACTLLGTRKWKLSEKMGEPPYSRLIVGFIGGIV